MERERERENKDRRGTREGGMRLKNFVGGRERERREKEMGLEREREMEK